MDWYKKLKISQKLMAVILMMISFMAIVGYTGYYFNAKAAASIKSMYNDKLMAIAYLTDYRSSLNGQQSAIYQLMLTTDNATKKRLFDEIHTKRKNNNQYWAAYKSTICDPYENERIPKVTALKPAYRIEQDKATDLAMKNKKDEAYKYYSTHGQSAQKVIILLQELGKYNETSAKALYAQNMKDVAFANIFLLLTILSAIVISGIIGFNMTEMFKRRFENLISLKQRLPAAILLVQEKLKQQTKLEK